MSHVFGSRSTICQYKGVTRGSLHTNSGAEQLVILNTRNPLETYGPPLPSSLRLVLSSSSPPSVPRRSPVLFRHPVSIPRRDLDIMLDKLAIQSNTKGYTAPLAATVGRRINLSVLWKLIKPSCESESIRSCRDDKAMNANVNIKRISRVLFVSKGRKFKGAARFEYSEKIL